MVTPKTHAAKKRKSHEGQRLQPQPPKTDAAKKRKSHGGQRRKHATCPVCNEAKIRDAFTSHAWLKLTKKKEHALCRTCTPKAVPSICLSYMSSTSSTSDTFVETFPSHKQRVYQYSPTKFRIRFATWETSHTRTNDQRYLPLTYMSSNGQGLMV